MSLKTTKTKSLDLDSLVTMKKLERLLGAAIPYDQAVFPLLLPLKMEAY